MNPSEPLPTLLSNEQTTIKRCAECKRLKLKCDRAVPCSTCVKRGCANICPNGQQQRGAQQESRMMLADNRRLRDKATSLQQRIYTLQAAIRSIRGESTDRSDSPQHSPSVRSPTSLNDEAKDDDEVEAVVTNFGTLHLGEQPEHIGGWGASDFLMMNGDKDLQLSPLRKLPGAGLLQIDAILLGWLNPMLTPYAALVAQLPERDTAFRVTSSYLSHLAWMVGGLINVDVYADLLEVVYPAGELASPTSPASASDLALLFTILALGALVDLDTKFHTSTTVAWWYCGCARAALALDGVPCKPSLQAVRVLHMMTWALHFLSSEYPEARKSAYSIQGMLGVLLKTMGMLRNDTGWILDETERNTRRGLVWDATYFCNCVSITHNRPPVLALAQLDALFLDSDPYPHYNAKGEAEESYTHFTHRYAKQVSLPVIHRAFGTRAVSYAMILQLDRFIQEYPIPPHLRVTEPGEPAPGATTEQIFQSLNILTSVRKLLIGLHRPFFAKALAQRGADPLTSPFRESFISAFRAATDVTSAMRVLYHHAPVSRRIRYLWSTCFSCCVVQCAIMIRAPNCILVPAAWHEFSLTLRMLEEFAPTAQTVAQMIPSLHKLRDKAIAAMADVRRVDVQAAELDAVEEAFIFGNARVVGTPGKCIVDDATALGNTSWPFTAPSPASSQETRVDPVYALQWNADSAVPGVDATATWDQILKAAEMCGTDSVTALNNTWNDLALDVIDQAVPGL